MKGTIFQKPLEFKISIEGETWKQGDSIQGTISVKNHGSGDLDFSQLQVHLAQGVIRKVHSKAPDAFKIIASSPLTAEETPWSFQTDRNCPITDTTGSLYLLYGHGADTTQLGQLQLNFTPYWIIEEFLNVLKTDFRFVVKTQKFSKGKIETKLAPPTAKSFATLEYLFVNFHFEGDTLEVGYVFQTKKLEATAASIDTSKLKKETSQVFESHEYLTPSGRINHLTFETAISEAMKEVLGISTS
jgi:hypothetical protein